MKWCILDRYGVWCAVVASDSPTFHVDGPPEGSWNVETLCGDFITLPFGIEFRYPTCPDCKEKS